MQRLCNNIEAVTGKKLTYKMVNNYDWFKNMNYLDFLREVGKNMTVNWMMNKDIVKKRISDPDKFISYAEFSYMLIMGYDYYVLNRDHNVTLEVGGSDEWDGILAGIEITHKLTGNTVYGLTNNLILDSNGKKF
jgi:tyrosyl-tRNA synthetase